MKKLAQIIFLLLLTSPAFSQSKMEDNLFREFNRYRKENGLDTALYDNYLSKIAENQVQYLVLCRSINNWESEKIHNQSYDFIGFEEQNYKEKQERVNLLDTNLFMLDLGEICYSASGQVDKERRVIDAWDGSPGHKKCMVQKGKKKLHVGIAYNGKEATIIFGARYDGQ
jgi:hypothetical protein